MKLTPEQLKQNAAAMIAFAEGKPIQIKLHNGIWKDDDTGNLDGIGDNDEYRPKPEPKTRPWSKPEDVPGPVCWIRNPEQERLIIAIDNEGVWAGSRSFGGCAFTWENFKINGVEYSTDRKTWHKCEVTE